MPNARCGGYGIERQLYEMQLSEKNSKPNVPPKYILIKFEGCYFLNNCNGSPGNIIFHLEQLLVRHWYWTDPRVSITIRLRGKSHWGGRPEACLGSTFRLGPSIITIFYRYMVKNGVDSGPPAGHNTDVDPPGFGTSSFSVGILPLRTIMPRITSRGRHRSRFLSRGDVAVPRTYVQLRATRVAGDKRTKERTVGGEGKGFCDTITAYTRGGGDEAVTSSRVVVVITIIINTNNNYYCCVIVIMLRRAKIYRTRGRDRGRPPTQPPTRRRHNSADSAAVGETFRGIARATEKRARRRRSQYPIRATTLRVQRARPRVTATTPDRRTLS